VTCRNGQSSRTFTRSEDVPNSGRYAVMRLCRRQTAPICRETGPCRPMVMRPTPFLLRDSRRCQTTFQAPECGFDSRHAQRASNLMGKNRSEAIPLQLARRNIVPDVTMCTDEDCPARNQCYRYRAIPNKHWQSYFKQSPRNDRFKESGFDCYMQIYAGDRLTKIKE